MKHLVDSVHADIKIQADPLKLLDTIPNIVLAIEAAETPEEISGIRGMVRTFQTYLKETLPGIIADRNETLTHLHKTSVLWIEASAKAGKIWQELENKRENGWNQHSESGSASVRSLSWADAGFKSDKDVTRCVRAAALDEADRWQYYEECRINAKEPSMNGIENVWREFFKIDILNSSESNEWYTPLQYIEAARRVMGHFDIDPASNDYAQQIIQAKTYYTIETNGLDKEWNGKCWLNPPYGDLCSRFVSRLLEQYNAGNVTEAILLVNAHAVETNWFSPLWNYLLCFTDHRINFVNPEGAQNGSTHGSVFVYLGNQDTLFYREYKPFGYVVKQVSYEHQKPESLP